jgi:predicted MPP superfamily phosphohydrolase
LITQEIRALLFVVFVAAIFVTAANFLLLRLYRKLFKLALPKSVLYRRAERVILVLAAIGLVCALYARLVEPFWPKVIRVQIATTKLPQGAHPIRIVEIGDTHCDPTARLEPRLPGIISAQHPDLIVFAGDSVNRHAALPVFRELMTQLPKIAPTFVVRGNWDDWDDANERLFAGTGVENLDGRVVRREFYGTPVWIGGLPTDSNMQVSELFAKAPANEFRLFVHHFPDRILPFGNLDGAAGKVDLMCAAHTHGGQIALPFYGALVTFSRYDKQFEWGLHRVDATWLYVNRGIGMEGGSAPRMRFWARPEITVIDIVPAT